MPDRNRELRRLLATAKFASESQNQELRIAELTCRLAMKELGELVEQFQESRRAAARQQAAIDQATAEIRELTKQD